MSSPSLAAKTVVSAAIAVLASLLWTGVSAEPRSYRIDPEHFSISFRAHHLGFADVIGLFLEGEGSFVFDEAVPAVTDVSVSIAAASVFTNHAARDGHLRSKDFLDADAHPRILFKGTKAERTGERTGRLAGELTLRGVTRPVTLDLVWNKSGEYPFLDKHYVVGVSARTTIRRSAFGMTYGVENDWVGDEVTIEIAFEAVRQ